MEPAAAAVGEEATSAASGVPGAQHVRARRRCRVYDINEHLLCALCSGYLVDATAIIECLHTCKSAVLRNRDGRSILVINPFEFRGSYSATSNNMTLVHWPLMGGRYNIWYSEEGTGRGRSPPRPLLAVPNVTAYQSTASVPLLCGFDVAMKGSSKQANDCQVLIYCSP